MTTLCGDISTGNLTTMPLWVNAVGLISVYDCFECCGIKSLFRVKGTVAVLIQNILHFLKLEVPLFIKMNNFPQAGKSSRACSEAAIQRDMRRPQINKFPGVNKQNCRAFQGAKPGISDPGRQTQNRRRD